MLIPNRCLSLSVFYTLIGGLFFLSSCSDEDRIHSNYIPINASVVVSVNTGSIFNASAFDLLGSDDLFNNLSLVPISSIIQNPSKAGLKIFSTYHIFVLESSLFQPKLGAILPLEDGEELSNYIEDNFETKIVKRAGLQMAEISKGHNIVWDQYTAIYYFGSSENDLIKEAKILFAQKNKNTLEEKDTTFSFALNANSHISTWIKNNAVKKLTNQGLSLLEDLNLIKNPLTKSKTILNGKTVFLTNFNKGNISIKQRRYIRSSKSQEKNKIVNKSELGLIAKKTVSKNPLLLTNTSLNLAELIEVLKLFNLDEYWRKQKSNFPFLPEINQLGSYFEGDVMVHVDGVQDVLKTIQAPDIDDEGNDVMVTKEIIEKNIDFSIGLLVKDSIKFNFILNILGSALPKIDGFFNYNNEVYFATKENYFFVTSTKKGVKYLNQMNGELSPKLDSIITRYKSVCYINIADILKQDKIFFSQFLGSFQNLNTILFFENDFKNREIIEGETVISFKSQENGFVSAFRLILELGSTFNSLSSTGIK